MAEPTKFKCEDCPEHGETRKSVHELERFRDLQRETNTDLYEKVDTVKDEVRDNREGLHRRISERIPIRHAITGMVLVVGIITTIITLSAKSSSRIEDKLDKLTERVAVMVAVSEERKHQIAFQERLLGVLLESLEEKKLDQTNIRRHSKFHELEPPYGKPGP